jgi:hypothetical protein
MPSRKLPPCRTGRRSKTHMNLWRRRGRRGFCKRVGLVTRTERLTFLLQSKQEPNKGLQEGDD